MAEERIDIVITERGSRVVKRNLEDIGASSRTSADAVDLLKRALGGLAAALSIQKIIQAVNAYDRLQNQLRVAGMAADQLAGSTDRLLKIANNTRQSIEATGTLYGRLAGASQELGATQEQLYTFVQAVGSALAVNGTEAGTAAGVLLQLSQAMGGTVIQAQEFNSVIDGARPLLAAAAKHIDGAGGSVSRLKAMVNDGEVTAEAFFKAVLKGAPQLEAQLGLAVTAIDQAFQVLSNNWTVFIGRLSETTGFSRAVSGAILTLAANLDTIAKVALSAAAGLALVGGTASAINLATRAVQALTAAIAANPVGFLLVVLTSAITALTLFRDQINLGVDDITTLGDLMRAFGETVGAVFSKIVSWARETFGPLIDLVRKWFDEVEFSVIGILRLVAKAVDTYYGLWFGAVKAVIALFKGLPAALGDLFTRALNVLLGKIGNFVNAAGELLSNVTEFAGLGKIAAVDLKLTNESAGAAAQLGSDVAGAFKEGFDSVNFAQDFLKGLTDRAQEIAKERTAAEAAADAPADSGGGGGGSPPGLGAEELKNLQDQLDAIVGSYDRVWAAQKEYADGVLLLNQAEAAGLITTERKNEVINLMKEQLRDALDPLGAVNRELDKERELLSLTADQREIENQVRSVQQYLMMQGILLTEQELAQLREKLTLIQEETKAADARNQVYQSIIGPQQEYIAQLQAINSLIADGSITREQANAFLVEQNQSLLEGTIEAQQAMLTNYEQTLAQIDALRQADLISEQTAAQMKARANADLYAKQLSNASSFFGNLASLSRSENRTLAAIGKAAAVTQATIDGVLAVQKALASAPPPANYALAAAVGVSAAANVASILSANLGFQTGGSFVVGGQGGPDSQMVAFRATPGEKVSVARPEQVRKGDPYEGGGASPTVQNNTRIVNVLDPALVGDYLSTPEGEQVLVNVMRRNSDSVRQIVGGA